MKKGTIAIEYAQELDDRYDDKLPTIPFYFGRKDCHSSPYGREHKSFPNALRGWDESYGWFNRNFGMNQQETIAILGAHTLGKTHEHYSGFGTKTWVKEPWILNNYYYASLIFEQWSQHRVNCDCEFGCKYEWSDPKDEYLMLNSDMCLFYDIEPDEDGYVYCPSKDYPEQRDEIRDVTVSYGTNNQLWLNDFAYSWEMMITAGYDMNDLTAYRVSYWC